MNFRPLLICLIATCIAFPAAVYAKTAKKPRPVIDCSAKLKKVLQDYQKKHYADVQLALTDMKISCSGHDAMDSIIYYLGMSYLLDKKAVEAKIEFQQLVRDFPNSVFFEEAHYRIGQSSYAGSNTFDRDQSSTKDALRELIDFTESYSESRFVDSARLYISDGTEKLAKKELMSARFYEKVEEYEAAIVYYKVVVTEYPQSRFVPEAKISMAEDLIKVNRMSEANEVLDEVINEPGMTDAIRTKARALKARVGTSG